MPYSMYVHTVQYYASVIPGVLRALARRRSSADAMSMPAGSRYAEVSINPLFLFLIFILSILFSFINVFFRFFFPSVDLPPPQCACRVCRKRFSACTANASENAGRSPRQPGSTFRCLRGKALSRESNQ